MTLAKLPGWALELLANERGARLCYGDDADRLSILGGPGPVVRAVIV